MNNSTLLLEEEEDLDFYQLSTFELIIWCILYASIAVLAVFGNLLVIYVTLSRLRTRSITTYFIINLAFADLLTGIFAIPFKFQAALFQKWFLPPILCKIVPYAETVTLSVSVFTLTASAIHEFRTVFFPKHGRLSANNARLLVFTIWVVAVLVSMPHGLFHNVFEDYGTARNERMLYEDDSPVGQQEYCMQRRMGEKDARIRGPQCLPVYAEENWWKVYNIYLTIITYFIPMIILDTAYTLIAIKIWTTTSSMNEELQIINQQGASTVETSNRKEGISHRSTRQLMKMLIIVVAVFSLCWFPLETYLLLNEVKPEINGWYYINVLFFCSHWLAMSNSCLNPIIYGLYNDKYNREYKRVFQQLWNRSWNVKSDLSGVTSQKFDTEYSAPTMILHHEHEGNHANSPPYIESFQIKCESSNELTVPSFKNKTSVRAKNGYVEVMGSVK